MIVHNRVVPDAVQPAIAERIAHDVTAALNAIVTVDNKFVVNDSLWFQERPNKKVTACVMNKAEYLSAKFQNTLKDVYEWEKEKELRGQAIDNFLALQAAGSAWRIPQGQFLDFLQLHAREQPVADFRQEFLASWHKYALVGIDNLANIPESQRRFFASTGEPGSRQIRIGLEFETGNIASAFRALDKLETLFVLGEIDYGVFVTSINKDRAATRIWPSSNRNGSFQELENRNYRNNTTVPLWEFGFEPDEFRNDAPYLGSGGATYLPRPTGKTVRRRGLEYEVFLRFGNEKILRLKREPTG